MSDVVNRQRMAFFVAVVAFGMPLAMLVSAMFGNCAYDSISHYYFSRIGGDIFVGSLFFIGAFLLAYQGEVWFETWLARLAAFAAYGVALFPTNGAGCQDPSFIGRVFMGIAFDGEAAPPDRVTIPGVTGEGPFDPYGLSGLHYGSAGVLFLILAIFCFFIFTRKIDEEHKAGAAATAEKTRRDRFYVICGFVILAAIIGLALKPGEGASLDWWNAMNLTFYLEMAALWAFGLSWAVKGRFGPFRETPLGRWITDPRDRAAQARSV